MTPQQRQYFLDNTDAALHAWAEHQNDPQAFQEFLQHITDNLPPEGLPDGTAPLTPDQL